MNYVLEGDMFMGKNRVVKGDKECQDEGLIVKECCSNKSNMIVCKKYKI